ncbi:MAG: cyclohexa-1,5-dienecarbonyl-CoA hydratase [Candidatus Zixiibacteriota bacterium]|nr:MAG: cyclohexa-1,5-dienecarbonyl-CoA hydratase [candidate division Zixibacteria bacterium]
MQFTGSGKHFSFGASVAEHVREQAPRMLEQFHGLFYRLIDLAIPTMALVSGQCLGGGMELALMCNLLFADKTAKLGQPEIMLGVFAPPASVMLPLKIGQARADDLLLTGRSITAEEAFAMGLATAVFDTPEAMHQGADQWFEHHLMPKSASSLRFAVRAARGNFNLILRDRLKELERLYVDELMATDDANEGIASFLESRQPEWKHA